MLSWHAFTFSIPPWPFTHRMFQWKYCHSKIVSRCHLIIFKSTIDEDYVKFQRFELIPIAIATLVEPMKIHETNAIGLIAEWSTLVDGYGIRWIKQIHSYCCVSIQHCTSTWLSKITYRLHVGYLSLQGCEIAFIKRYIIFSRASRCYCRSCNERWGAVREKYLLINLLILT